MVLTVLQATGDAERPRVRGPRLSGEGDRTVVWLHGEYDLATVDALAEGLATATALDDADLVVDLSEVQFIDAATIGVLVRFRNSLRPQSRNLTLRNAPRRARRVLDVCGLADIIDTALADADADAGAARLRLVSVPAVDGG